MAIAGFKIAAGWNNAAGLTNIEDIVPTNDRPFFPPFGYDTYDRGILRIKVDRETYETGFETVTWPFRVMTRAQRRYLQDTFTTGGNSHSGRVTIATRNEDGNYANYNAVMRIPKLTELNAVPGGYENVTVSFAIIEAL